MDERCMDHETMKRVVRCTSYCEVGQILNDYREMAFRDEIISYKGRAMMKTGQISSLPWYSEVYRIQTALRDIREACPAKCPFN